MKGNYWNDYVRVPWNVYVIGDCCYRVRVEETRKELSYLSAIGAVTTEGNFNSYSVCVEETIKSCHT